MKTKPFFLPNFESMTKCPQILWIIISLWPKDHLKRENFNFDSWAVSQTWDAAQTWLVPFEIVFSVSRFEPALNWNWFLAVQQSGFNSLNSASGDWIDLRRIIWLNCPTSVFKIVILSPLLNKNKCFLTKFRYYNFNFVLETNIDWLKRLFNSMAYILITFQICRVNYINFSILTVYYINFSILTVNYINFSILTVYYINFSILTVIYNNSSILTVYVFFINSSVLTVYMYNINFSVLTVYMYNINSSLPPPLQGGGEEITDPQEGKEKGKRDR